MDRESPTQTPIRQGSRISPVRGFFGPWAFLSNFFIEPDGTHVEGEYQQAKCATTADRDRFLGLSPRGAKALGQQIILRKGWEEMKLGIMFGLVLQKFQDHPHLGRKLLLTGQCELIEDNWWGDRYWGVYRGVGENHLGKLLMQVRGEL